MGKFRQGMDVGQFTEKFRAGLMELEYPGVEWRIADT